MDKQQPGIIRRIFSGLWQGITWARVAVLNLIFIFIVVLMFSAVQTEQVSPLDEPMALRLAPSGFLVDQRTYNDPILQILERSSPDELETLTRELVKAIESAATDSRITALILDLEKFYGGGISKLEEVGQALATFKESGKPFIAVSGNYSQQQYYLASYADEIYLNPMGAVLLTGYASYRQYYKSALDKLAVNYHVFRVGNYKDFIEPYTRNSMSDASREHNGRWLNELWSVYSKRVEQQRELPENALNTYINNLDTQLALAYGNSAQLALDAGLVDHIQTGTEIRSTLVKRFGQTEDEPDHIKSISYRDYLQDLNQSTPIYPDKVGLIVANGVIMDGEHAPGTIGSTSIAELLAQAREREDIKALVVRVDSGGGGAFASDLIYQELQYTRDAGIPIFISMGSVAASGGYWLATAADEIWATPTTITGSIGVFGAFPTVEKTLAKLGINTDGLGTTALAGSMRLDRDLPPIANSVIQQGVEFTYRAFLQRVAAAREQTPEAIHKVAQGQVWSGTQAKKLGLVDELGSLDDVIASAAKFAELDHYSVEVIERELSPQEALFKQLAGGTEAFMPSGLLESFAPVALRQTLAPLIKPFIQMSAMTDPKGIYVRCENCLAP